MNRRGILRLLSNYGMGIVLLLLCIYYSLATIQTRQLSGSDAVDDVAKKITSTNPKPIIILIAGVSPDDQEFAHLITKRLPINPIPNHPHRRQR